MAAGCAPAGLIITKVPGGGGCVMYKLGGSLEEWMGGGQIVHRVCVGTVGQRLFSLKPYACIGLQPPRKPSSFHVNRSP